MLEAVAVSGPATGAELRDVIEQRGGRFSGRAVAEAIRKGLIQPFSQPDEAVGVPDVEASITTRRLRGARAPRARDHGRNGLAFHVGQRLFAVTAAAIYSRVLADDRELAYVAMLG